MSTIIQVLFQLPQVKYLCKCIDPLHWFVVKLGQSDTELMIGVVGVGLLELSDMQQSGQ